MAIYTGKYVGARSCTSGPQPGARGAMDYLLAAHKKDGALNSGIYNCRTVRGGRTTSIHGEGRAVDLGVRPYSARWGWALANALVAMSKELGIQCVIWDRKIWSSAYPHSGFRRYSGVNPHRDHIHLELTWARANAGREATAKRWAEVLGGVKPDKIKGGGSGSSGSRYKSVSGKTPTVRLYAKGEPVKRVQKAVGAKVDGYFGPSSVAKTKAWQRRSGLAADGIVGPKSWAKINAKKSSGGGSSSGSGSSSSGSLKVDGKWGTATTRALQKALGVKVDGIRGRATVRAIQKRVGARQDGVMGKATIRGIQRRVGVRQDGIIGPNTVKALQRALNAGTF